jgi:hypothetical protein
MASQRILKCRELQVNSNGSTSCTGAAGCGVTSEVKEWGPGRQQPKIVDSFRKGPRWPAGNFSTSIPSKYNNIIKQVVNILQYKISA